LHYINVYNSKSTQQRVFDTQNAATEAQLASETRKTAEEIRPANTNYAYLPKREMFKVHLLLMVQTRLPDIMCNKLIKLIILNIKLK
jgi:hypothetical protein